MELLGLCTVDLEVLELEGRFVGGNHVQEITQLLLLQVFLAQILQVSEIATKKHDNDEIILKTHLHNRDE